MKPAMAPFGSMSVRQSAHTCVGREGFEPSKLYSNGFTVRPNWPLWHLPKKTKKEGYIQQKPPPCVYSS